MESADDAPNAFDGTLTATKVRDGRCGPVYLGMRGTGAVVEIEVLEKPSSTTALQDVLAQLQNRQRIANTPNIVSYLGYHVVADKIYILTEWLTGTRLRDLVNKSGPMPHPLVRSFIRQILCGLEQLHQCGRSTIFLDAENIVVTGSGTVKIEAPILDISTTGALLPLASLTLPEVLLRQRHMRNADIWLLGIIAAEMLSGNSSIGTSLGVQFAPNIKENQGSALEYILPQDVREQLDEFSLDFTRQCLIM